MKIVYKVVDASRKSIFAEGKYKLFYKKGEIVKAREEK